MEIQYLRNALIICLLVLLVGCSSSMPIKSTGNSDEYFINRDDESPFGSLGSVKQAATAEASEFCASKNKTYVEKYSIDKKRAALVWPETTIYFKCTSSIGTDVELKSESPESTKIQNGQKNSDLYIELMKLDELRKNNIINESEFQVQKMKILKRY